MRWGGARAGVRLDPKREGRAVCCAGLKGERGRRGMAHPPHSAGLQIWVKRGRSFARGWRGNGEACGATHGERSRSLDARDGRGGWGGGSIGKGGEDRTVATRVFTRECSPTKGRVGEPPSHKTGGQAWAGKVEEGRQRANPMARCTLRRDWRGENGGSEGVGGRQRQKDNASGGRGHAWL